MTAVGGWVVVRWAVCGVLKKYFGTKDAKF